MHELSIAHSLVRCAEDAARDLGRVRVNGVRLQLGPLAGVVRESLEFAWDVATAGTSIAGATLVIEDTDVIVRCPNCGAEGPPVSQHKLRCRACDTPTPEVLSGRELVLRALDYTAVDPSTSPSLHAS